MWMVRLGLILWLLAPHHVAGAGEAALAQRKAFLQAESYIRQGRANDYFAVADALKDYVLYPYLQYQWLSEHPEDQAAVEQFLRDYADSRYAPLLHEKWLLYLGKIANWPLLIKNYRGSNDAALQCYVAIAQFRMGQGETAKFGARDRWLSGQSLPENCETLFGEGMLNLYADKAMLWQRFQQAVTRDNLPLASSLQTKLAKEDQADAELWLKLHRQPQALAATAALKWGDARADALFTHAVRRWLNTDPLAAAKVWDRDKTRLAPVAETLADIDKRIAVELALRHDGSAYARLAALPNKDNISREWRVRVALHEQRWPLVIDAIADLPAELQQTDKWQYWLARALAATGRVEQANHLFERASHERSLYGFLAAERLNKTVQLKHAPLVVSAAELEALQQSDEFQAVAELLAIDRKTEAKRQWRYAVGKLHGNQLIAAAKLAQSWQAPALAIATIARTGLWDDLDLRFPLSYVDSISALTAVEPAVVLGLIRQESAFDETAESSAGAKGLMQLMPATAREVAVEAKLPLESDTSLFEPQRNIRIGGLYFQKLLKRFGGRYLPATAAYNAGPKRVGQWLPEHKPQAGDIWMETIPYKETRAYVAAVIGNSIVYQQRLGRNGLKALDLVGEIPPG